MAAVAVLLNELACSLWLTVGGLPVQVQPRRGRGFLRVLVEKKGREATCPRRVFLMLDKQGLYSLALSLCSLISY